jgi:hypothetical protein
MGPDSSKNLHPARLGKLARLPRPAPPRVRIHPSVPAAELFARIRMPRSLPEALTDGGLPPQAPPGPLGGVDAWARGRPGPGVVVDIRELLERRARQDRAGRPSHGPSLPPGPPGPPEPGPGTPRRPVPAPVQVVPGSAGTPTAPAQVVPGSAGTPTATA